MKINSVKSLVWLLYLLLISTIAYHVAFAKRIIPGVRIGNVFVGGKTYTDAKNALVAYENANKKDLVLKFNDRSYIIKPEEVSLQYNWDDTLVRAYEIGRSENFITDTKNKIAGLFKSLYLPAFYDLDDTVLAAKISLIKAETNTLGNDAYFSLDNKGTLVVNNAKEGEKIVDEALSHVVATSFDSIDFSEKVLPTKKVKPRVFESDLQPLAPEVTKVIKNKITITHGGMKWELAGNQLLDLLKFRKNPELNMGVDDSKFETLADSIAQEVNTLPQGQVTQLNGNKVSGFEIIKDGEEMDVKKFAKDFETALFGIKNNVEIPMKSISGPATKERYGILELLGEGISTFKGSIPSRIHNIQLAAERTNGVLVAPGKIYSMNNSIGDVDANTGYYTAYVIKGDRTVLGAGGGVCQVSTTLFRAVLNTGLPVVMRFPHAYRVGYYEQNMPVGFDAAIFQPSWDFKFKNDTPNYVLVQSYFDGDAQSLTFKIFGTPDGRSIQISEPEITNQSPPPPALYQDDPTLAKGVTKQVDFPAWGANVKFTRTVKRGDTIISEDTFTSHYAPWRAIYLVGTKK